MTVWMGCKGPINIAVSNEHYYSRKRKLKKFLRKANESGRLIIHAEYTHTSVSHRELSVKKIQKPSVLYIV